MMQRCAYINVLRSVSDKKQNHRTQVANRCLRTNHQQTKVADTRRGDARSGCRPDADEFLGNRNAHDVAIRRAATRWRRRMWNENFSAEGRHQEHVATHGAGKYAGFAVQKETHFHVAMKKDQNELWVSGGCDRHLVVVDCEAVTQIK